MKYEVTHRTTYHYSEPVTLGHNSSHLTPRTLDRQRCVSNRLVILPRRPACEVGPTISATRHVFHRGGRTSRIDRDGGERSG